MDGSGDPRPGKIWVHQTCPEEVAVEEHGRVCPWDDDLRGTHKLITPVASVM